MSGLPINGFVDRTLQYPVTVINFAEQRNAFIFLIKARVFSRGQNVSLECAFQVYTFCKSKCIAQRQCLHNVIGTLELIDSV